MKITGLKALQRPAGRSAQDAIERQQYIATSRRARPDRVREWALSDDEIRKILITNNSELIAAGGVEKPATDSHWWTVQRLGGAVLENGWSIVPQDRPGTANAKDRGDTRRPSLIPGTSWDIVKRRSRTVFDVFKPSAWRERRMSLREFIGLDELHGANLAIQCCAASMHVRVIDIDCRTPEIAEMVMRLAFKHLGTTPFVRVGNSPKLMLLYRVEGDDIAIGKFSVTLGNADGNDDLDEDGQPLNVVEFLAEGSIFTAYGLHHKTQRDFDWLSIGTLHPAAAGPQHAPLITKSMLRDFVNALQAFRPLSSKTVTSNPWGSKAAVTEFREKFDHRGRSLWIPKVSHGQWTINAEGKVVDGAEAWLTAQVWAALAANTDNLDAIYYIEEGVVIEAKTRLLGVHRSKSDLSSEASIERAVAQKIKYASQKWRDSLASKARGGDYHKGVVPWTVADDGRRPIPQRIRSERPADGSLDWLPTDTCPVDALSDIQPKAKTTLSKKAAEEVFRDYAARALIDSQEQRKATGESVSAGVRAHIGDWLESSVTPFIASGMSLVQQPWVLKAPTGAGKTVGVIDRLASFCKANPRGEGQGPILLVLPTHANGDEAVATAQRFGMTVPEMTEEEVMALIDSGKAAGVKIARFKGRAAAGCQRADELRALQEKGIRSSDLCEKRVPDGDAVDVKRAKRAGQRLENVTIMCPFKAAGTCAYWHQFDDLATADIVIVSHSYLTMNSLPKALKSPRAVIVDESTTYALLQQIRFPVSALQAGRVAPYVTKLDREMWPGASDETISAGYVQDREQLCAMVLGWFEAGKDIAVELMTHERCDDLLRSAVTVCDRSHTLDQQVRPDLTLAQVVDLADRPIGRHLIDEVRFWKIVRERIAAIRAGTAKGARDMRWQVVMDFETKVNDDGDKSIAYTPHIRLSWRRGPNWAGVPMLLLDASANARIIEKTYGAKPEIREVFAPLHVRTLAMIQRTWSNSAFIARPDATADEIKRIGETISEARRLITTKAVLFGHGRLLVGTTIAVREVLTGGGWAPPPNVDFVHFGALRGLDFAKHHVAAISIGRSEQPISVVDGYVAALTYDDDEPEQPYDVLGTGMTVEGKILFRKQGWRTIQMRSGQDVEHLIPEMPKREERWPDGKLKAVHRTWATELEESWREEEIRQFVGRLRPVYRGVDNDLPPPVWLAVGKILPEGIIVDEIVEMQSMIKISPMAELVRLGGGVLADNVTPKLPGAQELLQGKDLEAMEKSVLPDDKKFKTRFAAAFQTVGYELASEPGRRRSALVLAGWLDGNPTDAWLALSERYGELPMDLVAKPAKLLAPAAKRKPADKRDVSRDDQQALEAEVAALHREMDPELPRAEFEIRLGRGDYLASAAEV